MSDERLRVLERRYQESGAVHVHAALLRERVRAFELPRWRLELAALCQSEAARQALGELSYGEDLGFFAWLECVDAYAGDDHDVHARVNLALCHALQPMWDGSEAAWAACVAAEAWVLCPCWRHARAAFGAGQSCWYASGQGYGYYDWPIRAARQLVACTARMLPYGGEWRVAVRERASLVRNVLAPWTGRLPNGWDQAYSEVERQLGDPVPLTLRARVGREVAEWALGEGDAVRRRIAARE